MISVRRIVGAVALVGCSADEPGGQQRTEHVDVHGEVPVCGGTLAAAGFDLHETMTLDAFPIEARNQSLSELGLLPGDIVTLRSPEREMHLELAGGPCATGF